MTAEVTSCLGFMLGGPFALGRGGPGGWVFVHEPSVDCVGDVRVPDLGGWRLGRYAVVEEGGLYRVVPDWTCDVLSQFEKAKVRARKLPLYARSGVQHVWLVDPIERMVEVYRLDGSSYRYVRTAVESEVVALEPFDAVELDLSLLWRGGKKPESP